MIGPVLEQALTARVADVVIPYGRDTFHCVLNIVDMVIGHHISPFGHDTVDMLLRFS